MWQLMDWWMGPVQTCLVGTSRIQTASSATLVNHNQTWTNHLEYSGWLLAPNWISSSPGVSLPNKVTSHNFLCLLFLSVPATEERDMVAVEEERMLRLAEQCLERAKSFMGKSTAPLDVSISSSSSPGQSRPHQTAVLPCATAPNNGEYTPHQSETSFINIPSNNC